MILSFAVKGKRLFSRSGLLWCIFLTYHRFASSTETLSATVDAEHSDPGGTEARQPSPAPGVTETERYRDRLESSGPDYGKNAGRYVTMETGSGRGDAQEASAAGARQLRSAGLRSPSRNL